VTLVISAIVLVVASEVTWVVRITHVVLLAPTVAVVVAAVARTPTASLILRLEKKDAVQMGNYVTAPREVQGNAPLQGTLPVPATPFAVPLVISAIATAITMHVAKLQGLRLLHRAS